jgi:hypothetical protein
MSETRIETGKSAELIVRCRGDLQVGGWAEPAVLIKGDTYTTNIGPDEDKTLPVEKALSIDGSGDLVLMVPAAATLLIDEVNGDLQVRNLEGDLKIVTVSGDAALRSLGTITIDSVHGDLAVRHVNGPFSAREIMGDASLRNVEALQLSTVFGDCAIGYANGDVHVAELMGDLSLKTINGNITVSSGHRDINLRNLGGLVSIEAVHGDIRLLGGLTPGKHSLSAEGDIVVRWPVDEPLVVTAVAPTIQNFLPLVDVAEEEGAFRGRLGDGQTILSLRANGRIILKESDSGTKSWEDVEGQAFGFDLGGLGDHIAAEINSRMADFSVKMETQFGPEFAARMEEKARAAAVRAEKAAEKALRQAEKAAQKARWQSGQGGQWTPPPAPQPPGKKASQVSEEEQLKILRMVENGIISPDEANDLLEAISA